MCECEGACKVCVDVHTIERACANLIVYMCVC